MTVYDVECSEFIQDWTEIQRKRVISHCESLNWKEEYIFADNFRYARSGNELEMKAYTKAYRKGCCGYCDTALICEDDSIILFGFNYGH